MDFSPSVSQRLIKVDEESELREFAQSNSSTNSYRTKEPGNTRGTGLRKLTEKEQKFKNKYRWAEKQHKFRTGKCEGYSFNSIKAGLRKQDYLDTINWSPINNTQDAQYHLPDLVKQLIIESHAAAYCTEKAARTTDSSSIDSSQPLGHMSEEDWQLAKSRKLKPLRTRGSNTLSSQMNLDSFIDAALSEQVREECKSDSSADLSLTDLQSAKLIDSRFGWSKVRRAVTATAAVKSSLKVIPQKINPTDLNLVSNSLNSLSPAAPLTAEGSVASTYEANQSTEFGDSTMFESQTSYQSASNLFTPQTAESTNSQLIVRSLSSSAPNARPSTAKANLSFHVPVSSTSIRPKSAIFTPTKNVTSMVAPVNELVDALKRETNRRPKSSSGAGLENSPAAKYNTQERPKTATFRIAPSLMPTRSCSDDSVMIDAMLATRDDQADRSELLCEEKKMFDNYRGLIYRDPSRRTTWQGVEDLLAPAPLLSKEKSKEDSGMYVPIVNRDVRWAGRTLNSYRPWSPVRTDPPFGTSNNKDLAANTHLNSISQLHSGGNTTTAVSSASPSTSGRHTRTGNNSPSSSPASPTREIENCAVDDTQNGAAEIESASPPRSIPHLSLSLSMPARDAVLTTSTSTISVSTKTAFLPSPTSSPAVRRAKRLASLSAVAAPSEDMAEDNSPSGANSPNNTRQSLVWSLKNENAGLQSSRKRSSSAAAGTVSRSIGTASCSPSHIQILKHSIPVSGIRTPRRGSAAHKRPALLINLITKTDLESAQNTTLSNSIDRRHR